MSQENVELVERTQVAWDRRDFDEWLSYFDPNVEWHTALERLVEGADSVFRGHEGMRALWDTYRTELEDFQVETHELRDLGDDRVLWLGHIRWRGAASGIVVDSPVGRVGTVRNGKFVRAMDYLGHEEALKAVGLRE